MRQIIFIWLFILLFCSVLYGQQPYTKIEQDNIKVEEIHLDGIKDTTNFSCIGTIHQIQQPYLEIERGHEVAPPPIQTMPPFNNRKFCPACADSGWKSVVYEGGCSCTLMYWQPYYDENGVYHNDNPNVMTCSFWCSKGHSWVEKNGCIDYESIRYEKPKTWKVLESAKDTSLIITLSTDVHSDSAKWATIDSIVWQPVRNPDKFKQQLFGIIEQFMAQAKPETSYFLTGWNGGKAVYGSAISKPDSSLAAFWRWLKEND